MAAAVDVKDKLHFHKDTGDEENVQNIDRKVEKELLDECNDGKLTAADIGPCINSKITGGPKISEQEGDTLKDKTKHRRKRVVKHWLKWPKHEDGNVYVPYKFSTTISNATDAFLLGASDIQRFSCVRLVPKTSSDSNYIDVISGRGCYAYMGMQGGGQELSLQAYTACARKGVAIHEILHSLGFYHEMFRRDRDKFIEVHYDNIFTSEVRQFDIHNYANGSVYGEPYDTKSIMHYGNYAFAVNKTLPTLTSKINVGESLGQRDGMSVKDKIELNKMYQCENFITRV